MQNYHAIQQHYTQWLNTLGFNENTIRSYSYRVNDFFKWLIKQNITTIQLVQQNHITNFFTYQQNRTSKKSKNKLSPSYLNDYFNAIDKLLEFIHQTSPNSGINITPTHYRVKINKEQQIAKIKPFTIKEIKLLQSKIPYLYPQYNYKHQQLKHQQLKLVFALFYGCGLRKSEGAKLTFKDINFNKHTIFIRQSKNYKDRIVPINKGVYNILEDYIYNFRNLIKCGHDKLFIQNINVISQDLKELQKQATKSIQNKRLHYHILRHSIATHLLQKGMAIENIARFLGHSSLTSTQIYTTII